jgi:hypothetical protein
MPIAIVLFLLDVTLIIHAAKTGRFSPWAYVILFLPGIGSLAYILVELLPEWMGGVQGQKARRSVVKTLNPEKRYRDLVSQLELTDTIANRVSLAEECLALGKFEEAEAHYEDVLRRPLGDEPAYALGKARAQFGLRQLQQVVATLDHLRARWPDFQSADGHMLYRALEEAGDGARWLIRRPVAIFPDAEARVRHGLLLGKRPRTGSIGVLEVMKQAKRAPRYVRRRQAEWINAERELPGEGGFGNRPVDAIRPAKGPLIRMIPNEPKITPALILFSSPPPERGRSGGGRCPRERDLEQIFGQRSPTPTLPLSGGGSAPRLPLSSFIGRPRQKRRESRNERAENYPRAGRRTRPQAREYERILKLIGSDAELTELGIFGMWNEHCSVFEGAPANIADERSSGDSRSR